MANVGVVDTDVDVDAVIGDADMEDCEFNFKEATIIAVSGVCPDTEVEGLVRDDDRERKFGSSVWVDFRAKFGELLYDGEESSPALDECFIKTNLR